MSRTPRSEQAERLELDREPDPRDQPAAQQPAEQPQAEEPPADQLHAPGDQGTFVDEEPTAIAESAPSGHRPGPEEQAIH